MRTCACRIACAFTASSVYPGRDSGRFSAVEAHSMRWTRATCAVAHRTSGEYVLETDPCQLLSLGCRTANKRNHVGAAGGAGVVALPARPRTITKAKRTATQHRPNPGGPDR